MIVGRRSLAAAGAALVLTTALPAQTDPHAPNGDLAGRTRLADIAAGSPPNASADAIAEFRSAIDARVTRVANTSALGAASVLARRVVREGFATPGDGGTATYTYSAASCRIPGGDGGSQVPSAAGGCWLVDWASVGGVATIELFGGAIGVPIAQEEPIIGQGLAADAQPALQAALATGQPVRLGPFAYYVARASRLRTPGQPVAGASDWFSRLVYTPAFSLANGAGILTHDADVFNFTGQEGPKYRDFMIKGFQPDVSSNGGTTDAQRLASLVQVSCIDARNTVATLFERLTLTTCLRGIDMRGRSGQVTIDQVKGTNFLADVEIDGATDSVRISKFHAYPFAVTPNQAALIQRTASSIRTGRMDDLKVVDSMCIQSARCIHAYRGVARTLAADGYVSEGGITTASFASYDFDVAPLGWLVDEGVISFTGGYYASIAGGIQNGGIVTITGPSVMNMNSDRYITLTNGTLTITGIGNVTGDVTDFTFLYQTGGQLVFANNNYGWNPHGAVTTTRPKIWTLGGRIVATGNLVQARGTGVQSGASSFFRVEGDTDFHVVANNSTPGWTNDFPAQVRGLYGPNAGEQQRTSFPLYSEVTAVWTPQSARGRRFTIRDAGGDYTFGGPASGGGNRVGTIGSDGARFRYGL